MLAEFVERLKHSLGILHKQDIQAVSRLLSPPLSTTTPLSSTAILLGDDCAAIPDPSGYLLLAAEGIMPFLVDSEPWFAGWCAVMVNVSDIYAMGGRPIAIVDTLWSQSIEQSEPLLQGMQAAAQAYNVPIVGGHTNCHSPYNALSVAILGRATQLITSFNAKPGDWLLLAIDLRGTLHPKHPFWNAATQADPTRLREDLAILPQIAETGLCKAGKDISMGGMIGTALMLLETSGCGATLDLDAIPVPVGCPLEKWLICFPSYGFLLSVCPENVAPIQDWFHRRNLVCTAIGQVQPTHQLILQSGSESALFWDLVQHPLTGFNASCRSSSELE